MRMLVEETREFRNGKAAAVAEARQSVALLLMCGIDLRDALLSEGAQRIRLAARLARLIERERLKGAKRHWSYDLNRHIALKQVFDRLRGANRPAMAASTGTRDRK